MSLPLSYASTCENVISDTLLGMKLRSVVLAALALLLLGTPARADTVVFTPGNPGVDFSLNDDIGFLCCRLPNRDGG